MLHETLPIEHRIIYNATRCLRTTQEEPFTLKEFENRISLYNDTVKKSIRRLRYLESRLRKSIDPDNYDLTASTKYHTEFLTLTSSLKSAEEISAYALKWAPKSIDPEYSLSLAS